MAEDTTPSGWPPPGPSSASRRCGARHLANLAEAHQRLHAADLERAAALLADAGAVLVAGDGVSATLASLFATLLRRAALSAERLPTEGLDRALRLAGA